MQNYLNYIEEKSLENYQSNVGLNPYQTSNNKRLNELDRIICENIH